MKFLQEELDILQSLRSLREQRHALWLRTSDMNMARLRQLLVRVRERSGYSGVSKN